MPTKYDLLLKDEDPRVMHLAVELLNVIGDSLTDWIAKHALDDTNPGDLIAAYCIIQGVQISLMNDIIEHDVLSKGDTIKAMCDRICMMALTLEVKVDETPASYN